MNYQSKIVAVNHPGGLPNQFCVQVREGDGCFWRRSAVFRDSNEAIKKTQELKKQGVQARMIHYRLPTAA